MGTHPLFDTYHYLSAWGSLDFALFCGAAVCAPHEWVGAWVWWAGGPVVAKATAC